MFWIFQTEKRIGTPWGWRKEGEKEKKRKKWLEAKFYYYYCIFVFYQINNERNCGYKKRS